MVEKTISNAYLRMATIPVLLMAGSSTFAASAFAATGTIGSVFVINMENHNLTQPSSYTGAEQLLGNAAAPYMNSLITPGNANAAQTSWASNYTSLGSAIHPSETDTIWQEAGSSFGVSNDNDPYATGASNLQTSTSLTGLLQSNGISWKSYQEDIDMQTTSGSVNQPGANGVTGTVAPTSQWTVPTTSFSGTSANYANAYNGSNQYDFATKHDGSLFFTDSNGGSTTAPDFSSANPEVSHYSPLQQLSSDLTNNTAARYNLITPDEFNDGHTQLNGGFTYKGIHYTGDSANVAQADNFLSLLIPQIEASQAFQNNGLITIWWDETEGGDSSDYTLMSVNISPLAKGNAYDSTVSYTHSSDLLTLQKIFGVDQPGELLGAAANPSTNDFSDMFVSGAITGAASAPEPAAGLLSLTATCLAGIPLSAGRWLSRRSRIRGRVAGS